MATIEETDEIAKMKDFVPQVDKLFSVVGKVGEGTFSKVFRAKVKGSKMNAKEYALKYLVPTSRPSRIASELKCLKEVGGSSNIVGVESCLMEKGHVVIVMPYIPHERFIDYMKLLNTSEIREYMKNLFIALEKVHAHGIIHRDIKPNNFLYDKKHKMYALVDFGLAQRVSDFKKYGISTPKPKSPLKDHNSLQCKDRLNKSEPLLLHSKDMKNNVQELSKRPFKSTPFSVSKKRTRSYDQENKCTLPNKRSYNQNSTPIRSGAWQPLSSRVNILPTPPQTPSRYSQTLPIKTLTQELANRKAGQKPATNYPMCPCFGKNMVCKICLGRETEEAARGGTPGFRAPEVLMKHRAQTTAIDMWSAGVILLSLLSTKYPFFRADDDLTALAEIVLLVGIQEMKEAALTLGKSLVLHLPQSTEEATQIRKTMCPSRYLQALCTLLRHTNEENHIDKNHSFSNKLFLNLNAFELQLKTTDHCNASFNKSNEQIPESAYDLLNRLLDPNPSTRITAAEALQHPFITNS